MPQPFAMDPALTAISIAYRNASLIADRVLPRVTAVPKKQYAYNLYPTGTLFTVPNTHVGRRSAPREVNFESTRTPAEIEDYALEDVIPQDDIDQAAAQNLPKLEDRSTSFLSDLIALDREVRVAALVFASGSYPSDKRVTLSGSDQWSHADGDPIEDIEVALNTPLLRPNIGIMGQGTWSAVRRNPRIVKAVNKTSGDTGLVRKEDFAEVFELEELIIGNAYVNTAKPGQTATLARTWGKHAAFIHRSTVADADRGVTFGMTVPYGTRVAGSMPDAKIGIRGGVRVRVGESVDEIITAPDTGYFVQNAVA